MTLVKPHKKKNILHTIIDWSKDIPNWQQDALRRIVETGEISRNDADELTVLCRDAHGLVEDETVPVLQPLVADNVPAGPKVKQQVTIRSIAHPENVNALDATQELRFGSKGLTVVFGYNGSGKSGYGRILRRACRARTKGEPILPNVLSSGRSDPASAELTYALDNIEQPSEQWIDGLRSVDALGAVSFFDSDCATAHVRQRNEVAFTPFGLDVLPKLGSACKEVQQRLDVERKRLEAIQPPFLRSTVATGATAVGKLLKSLRYDTDFDEVEALATLSDGDLQRLRDLPAQLANDPQKVARELRTRSGRLSTLRETIQRAMDSLTPDAVQKLAQLAIDADRKAKAAETAARMTFSLESLPEIGDDVWRELWEAARKYSAVAYPNQDFPVVDSENALCVLCQQPLEAISKARLRSFEDFVSNQTASTAEQAKIALNSATKALEGHGLRAEGLREQLKDVEISDANALVIVRKNISALLWRLRKIRNSQKSGDWDFAVSEIFGDAGIELRRLIDLLVQQAIQMEKSQDIQERRKLEFELTELKARDWLSTVLGDVKEHIDRLDQLQKLQQCISETKTIRITTKSKELAKEFVTDQLRDAFATEIKRMEQGVRRLNVELSAAAGEYGASYYQIRLVGASQSDLGTVVSEGEHRCIALAGFLSELTTEQCRSAIIFDDPVTSLDHLWRDCFARRLVEESAVRQVIVFTHDIVFLHDLIEGANRSKTDIELKRVQSTKNSCGHVSDGLPWIAQKTLARIDDLEKQARASRTDYDAHNDDDFERTICNLYSDLRATIERTVEEYLFRNVVVRHRDYISLGNLKQVTAVTILHCEGLQSLFEKCCDITTAHDRSSLRSFGIPTPDDALDDLSNLKKIIEDLKAKQKAIC